MVTCPPSPPHIVSRCYPGGAMWRYPHAKSPVEEAAPITAQAGSGKLPSLLQSLAHPSECD